MYLKLNVRPADKDSRWPETNWKQFMGDDTNQFNLRGPRYLCMGGDNDRPFTLRYQQLFK